MVGSWWGAVPLALHLSLSLPEREEVLAVLIRGPSALAALPSLVGVLVSSPLLVVRSLIAVVLVSAHGRHLLGQEPSSFLESLQAFQALLEFESIRVLCGLESFQPGGVLFVVRSSSP